MEISVTCCLCDNEIEIQVPDSQYLGWANVDDVYDESALCPDHAHLKEFFSSVCPGCVGGWPDCQFYKNFRRLSSEQFVVLESGRCPLRTNGTYLLGRGSIDISDVNVEAGKKMAEFIRSGNKPETNP